MSWEFTIDGTNRADLLALVRDAPDGWRFTLERPAYTDLQMKKFNAMCNDLARQLEVFEGERFTPREWKHWLTAGWQQQRMVHGMEPRTIVFVGDGLGTGKGRKSKATTANLIELAYWYGSQRGVKWSKEAQHTPADPEGPPQLEEGPSP